MEQEMTCGWQVAGTVARPVLCGKPAKAQTAVNAAGCRSGLVCGVHARSARTLEYEVTDLPGPDVRPGQVWEDSDHRITRGELPRRQVRVVAVDATHATVELAAGSRRKTRVRLDRFRPTSTGYRLVQDVEG